MHCTTNYFSERGKRLQSIPALEIMRSKEKDFDDHSTEQIREIFKQAATAAPELHELVVTQGNYSLGGKKPA